MRMKKIKMGQQKSSLANLKVNLSQARLYNKVDRNIERDYRVDPTLILNSLSRIV